MSQKTLIVFFVGLIVGSVSLSYAAWSEPTATPPNDNVSAPINVSNLPQDKVGVLTLGGLGVFGGTLMTSSAGYTLPTNLQLGVNGYVGAKGYCDEKGQNCVTTMGNSTGIGSSGGSLSVVAGGVIVAGNSETNLGSNWDVISLTGTYISQDAAPTGGYIYKLNGKNKASIVEATGIYKDVVLTSEYQCVYTLCVKISGNNVYIKPGQNTLSYLVLAGSKSSSGGASKPSRASLVRNIGLDLPAPSGMSEWPDSIICTFASGENYIFDFYGLGSGNSLVAYWTQDKIGTYFNLDGTFNTSQSLRGDPKCGSKAKNIKEFCAEGRCLF